MEMSNNIERLQIFKNNKQITTIYTNNKSLFILNTSPMKDIDIIETNIRTIYIKKFFFPN